MANIISSLGRLAIESSQDDDVASPKLNVALELKLARVWLSLGNLTQYFEVMHANCNSIENANVIFLGETHCVDEHGILNALIIKRFYKEGDVVLVEAENTVRTKYGQLRFLNQQVNFKNWDDKTGFNEIIYSWKKIYLLVTESIDLKSFFDAYFSLNMPQGHKTPVLDRAFEFFVNLPEMSQKECEFQFKCFVVDCFYDHLIIATHKILLSSKLNRNTSLVNSTLHELTFGGINKRVFTVAGRDHQRPNVKYLSPENRLEPLYHAFSETRYITLFPLKMKLPDELIKSCPLISGDSFEVNQAPSGAYQRTVVKDFCEKHKQETSDFRTFALWHEDASLDFVDLLIRS